MARIAPKVLLLLACAGAAAVVAAPPAKTPATPLSPLGDAPIVVDAASSEADLNKGTGSFKTITITQGGVKLTADSAHGSYPVDFKNSHWTFEGHVHIEDSDRHGSLRADEAVVNFRNGRIEHATVTGKPAEFEQQRSESHQLARGHAQQIEYDINDGSVRLSDDAWLSDGQNEISGPLLVYNINAQKVQAATAPGADQRVHIVITPQGTSTKTAPVQPQTNTPP
ncbi:MAG TPA: lipopolysaccharide transport periplasmic protein LptA [Steroidobacteraceae bacterium]|jgi:lipopolysaccharide transport protein LptA|nr:lipopolysaccharide transport periplasmic protein LptA [Steroidobacteraceae bacterium]